MRHRNIECKEEFLCPICREKGYQLYSRLKDFVYGFPGEYGFMRCSKCDLLWLNPSLISEDIEKLYRCYYTHEVDSFKTNKFRKWLRDAILGTQFGYDDLIKSAWQKWIGKILGGIGILKEIANMGIMTLNGNKRGKLLDVGCGNGWFIDKMRYLGWEVYGVEIDKEAVKIAKEDFKLDVFCGTIKEAQFPDNYFDAITMNHVIEHILEPWEVLRDVYRILNPSGKLIIVTPNINSLGHKHFKHNWQPLDIPRHLYLFSVNSLSCLAGMAGFISNEVKTTSRGAFFVWVYSSLIKKFKSINELSSKGSLLLRVEGFIFQLMEYFYTKRKNVGEEIIMIMSKRNT